MTRLMQQHVSPVNGLCVVLLFLFSIIAQAEVDDSSCGNSTSIFTVVFASDFALALALALLSIPLLLLPLLEDVVIVALVYCSI